MIIVMIMITTQMIMIMWLHWGLCYAFSLSLHALIIVDMISMIGVIFMDDQDYFAQNFDHFPTCSLQSSWRMLVRHEGVLCLKLGGLNIEK